MSSLRKFLLWTNKIINSPGSGREIQISSIDEDLLKRTTVKTLLGEILLLPPSQLKDPELKVELAELKKQILSKGKIYKEFFTWLNTTFVQGTPRIKVQEIPDSFIADRFISDLIGIKAVDKNPRLDLARPLSVTLVEPDQPVRISGSVNDLRQRILTTQEPNEPTSVEPASQPPKDPSLDTAVAEAAAPTDEIPDLVPAELAAPANEIPSLEPAVSIEKPVTDKSKPVAKIDPVKQAAYYIDENEYFNALFIEQAYRATQNFPSTGDKFKSAYKHELVRQYAFLKYLFQKNQNNIPVKGYSAKSFVNNSDLYDRMNLLVQGNAVSERFLPVRVIDAAREAGVLNVDLQSSALHSTVNNFPEFQYNWSQDYLRCLKAILSETAYEEPQIEPGLIDTAKEKFRSLAEENRKTNNYEYATEDRNRELVLEAYMKRFGEVPPLQASKIADKRAKVFGAKNAQDLYERLCAKDDKHILPHMVLIAASRQQGFMDLMRPYDGFDKVVEKKAQSATASVATTEITAGGEVSIDSKKLPDSSGVVTSSHVATEINWREFERGLNGFSMLQEAFDNLLRISQEEWKSFPEVYFVEIYRKNALFSYVFANRHQDTQVMKAIQLGYTGLEDLRNDIRASKSHRFVPASVMQELLVQCPEMTEEYLRPTFNTDDSLFQGLAAHSSRFINQLTKAKHEQLKGKVELFTVNEEAFESYFRQCVEDFKLEDLEDGAHYFNENASRRMILKAYFMRFGQSALEDSSRARDKRAQIFGFRDQADLIEVLTKSESVVPPTASLIASAYSGLELPRAYSLKQSEQELYQYSDYEAMFEKMVETDDRDLAHSYDFLQIAKDNLLAMSPERFLEIPRCYSRELERKNIIIVALYALLQTNNIETHLTDEQAQSFGYATKGNLISALKGEPGFEFMTETSFKRALNIRKKQNPSLDIEHFQNVYGAAVRINYEEFLHKQKESVVDITRASRKLYCMKVRHEINLVELDAYIQQIVDQARANDKNIYVREDDNRIALIKAYYRRFGVYPSNENNDVNNRRARVFACQTASELFGRLINRDSLHVEPHMVLLAHIYLAEDIDPNYDLKLASFNADPRLVKNPEQVCKKIELEEIVLAEASRLYSCSLLARFTDLKNTQFNPDLDELCKQGSVYKHSVLRTFLVQHALNLASDPSQLIQEMGFVDYKDWKRKENLFNLEFVDDRAVRVALEYLKSHEQTLWQVGSSLPAGINSIEGIEARVFIKADSIEDFSETCDRDWALISEQYRRLNNTYELQDDVESRIEEFLSSANNGSMTEMAQSSYQDRVQILKAYVKRFGELPKRNEFNLRAHLFRFSSAESFYDCLVHGNRYPNFNGMRLACLLLATNYPEDYIEKAMEVGMGARITSQNPELRSLLLRANFQHTLAAGGISPDLVLLTKLGNPPVKPITIEDRNLAKAIDLLDQAMAKFNTYTAGDFPEGEFYAYPLMRRAVLLRTLLKESNFPNLPSMQAKQLGYVGIGAFKDDIEIANPANAFIKSKILNGLLDRLTPPLIERDRHLLATRVNDIESVKELQEKDYQEALQILQPALVKLADQKIDDTTYFNYYASYFLMKARKNNPSSSLRALRADSAENFTKLSVLRAYVARFGIEPAHQNSQEANARAQIFGCKDALDLYERLTEENGKFLEYKTVKIALAYLSTDHLKAMANWNSSTPQPKTGDREQDFRLRLKSYELSKLLQPEFWRALFILMSFDQRAKLDALPQKDGKFTEPVMLKHNAFKLEVYNFLQTMPSKVDDFNKILPAMGFDDIRDLMSRLLGLNGKDFSEEEIIRIKRTIASVTQEGETKGIPYDFFEASNDPQEVREAWTGDYNKLLRVVNFAVNNMNPNSSSVLPADVMRAVLRLREQRVAASANENENAERILTAYYRRYGVSPLDYESNIQEANYRANIFCYNSAKELASDLLGLNDAQITDSSPAYLCAQAILAAATESTGSQLWSFAKHVVGETGLAVKSDIASAAMRLTGILDRLP